MFKEHKMNLLHEWAIVFMGEYEICYSCPYYDTKDTGGGGGLTSRKGGGAESPLPLRVDRRHSLWS